MKTFKKLLAVFAVICLFGTGAFAQNGKITDKFSWGTQEEPFCFYCPCANDGNGEWLCGTIVLHIALNSKVEHWNMKGNKLEGSETGKIYHFVRTENVKWNDDGSAEVVMNVRTIGEGGLTTYWQIVGTATIPEWYGDWFPSEPTFETFYCR